MDECKPLLAGPFNDWVEWTEEGRQNRAVLRKAGGVLNSVSA